MSNVMSTAGLTLKLELAMSVDAYDLFVRHCYTLEGDSVLVFRVYDCIMELQQHVVLVRQGGAGTPNTRAVALTIVEQQFPQLLAAVKAQRVVALVQEQLAKVERSFVYFETTIIANMAENLAIYKAFRLFDPARIDILGANADEVEAQLKLIPFFDDNEVAALMAELPTYRALVIGEGVGGNVDREAWWAGKAAAPGVGRWYAGATMVMICQPSSAAAGVLHAQGHHWRPTASENAPRNPGDQSHGPIQRVETRRSLRTL